jgi:transmembrane sensor
MDSSQHDSTDMNNVSEFTNKALIKEQAGQWLVRIDQGSLSDTETKDFQAWVKRSRFHQEYIEKLTKNWDSMSVLQELAELFPINDLSTDIHSSGNAKKTNNKTSKPTGNSLLGWMINWPASSAVATVMAFGLCITLLMNGAEQPKELLYSTKIGQQATYTLEDGSTLSLNTNSRVKVDFSGDVRAITLLGGEANFDVAKNPNRPFVVYAGTGLVWAVGTRFNVRYTTDDIDVTVSEGIIKVYANINSNEPIPRFTSKTPVEESHKNEALVEAGQSIQFSHVIKSQKLIVAEKLEQSLAWQKGALVFNGETLEQALLEIGRYTEKKLIIVDPTIKDIRVGGHYKTDDVKGLLDTFSKGFDITITEVAHNRVHISNNLSTH